MVSSGRVSIRGPAALGAHPPPRRGLGPDATPENLVEAWRAKAISHGLDDRALAAALHRQEPHDPPSPASPAAEALFVRLAAPDGLTARRSTFGRAQVLEAICDRLPQVAQVVDIVALGDAFLAYRHVIPISPSQPEVGGTEGSPAADIRVERWTTPEMVATERRLLHLVEAPEGTDRTDTA